LIEKQLRLIAENSMKQEDESDEEDDEDDDNNSGLDLVNG
jgi:hypothetical protein